MQRALSHSEVSTALDCWAKHAFAYTGALTGGTALSPKRTAPLLRDGRAWGAGVAAFHAGQSGFPAIVRSLQEDADEQREHGLYDEESFASTLGKLDRTFRHYIELTEPLGLCAIEHELMVPIPSRLGRRHSTKYRLHCFLDGVHRDDEGREWIVEFKFRGRLSDDRQIALSRQIRWYAWAWREHTGHEPAGVIVDERLNFPPAAVRLNKDGSPSKVQSCTPAAYEHACKSAGTEPDDGVLVGLRSKEWQKRTTIMFRPAELDEAGFQLVSAGSLIHQLDSERLYPIRNPSPARCPSCQFRDICDVPEDRPLVDSLFKRVTPKHERLAA